MTKPPRRVSANKRLELPDSRHVAFLYGDLGLDQRRIAQTLKVSIGSVERSVKQNQLVRHCPPNGEWSEGLVRELAGRLHVTLPDLNGRNPEDVWTRLRVALRGEVPKALARDGKAGFVLDSFLDDLPYLVRASAARLTPARLQFLHGDLGMNAQEIALLFDASWSAVRAALDREKVHRNEMVHHDLDEDLLTQLARSLGRSEWVIHRGGSDGYIRMDRHWSAIRRGVSAGLHRLKTEGRLDLAVLDQFIAAIPRLVAERRARRLGTRPAMRTVSRTKKAA